MDDKSKIISLDKSIVSPSESDLQIYIKNRAAERFWHRGDLTWLLDELQLQIINTIIACNARRVCILSSRQIGKSFAMIAFALMFALINRRKIVRILGPTKDAAYQIVDENLIKVIETAPHGLIQKKKSDLRWNLSNGSSLRIGTLERAHVDRSNRGGNAALILYEEPGFVPSDDFDYGVDSVMNAQLLRSKGQEVFISSPSPEFGHSLHVKIKTQCQMLGTFFSYTVYDSPSISEEQIEAAAERIGGKDSDAFKREYLAQILRDSEITAVPSFTRECVQVFTRPSEAFYTVTFDWGGTRDFTVGFLHTYDYMSDHYLILDEIVHKANTSTPVISGDINSKWMNSNTQEEYYKGTYPDDIYADVPGQTGVDLREAGIPVQAPQKSDWKSNRQNLDTLFAQGKILIDPRCTFLITSLENGILNKNKTDFERTKELGHMDAIAALMYAVRVQNKTNPYAHKRGNDERQDVAKVFAPKKFGVHKR